AAPALDGAALQHHARVSRRADRDRRRAAVERHEPNVGRQLVVADWLGRAQPELPGMVGTPALHVAAVEQRTAVVGDRHVDHARRRARAALLLLAARGLARVLLGLAGLFVAADRGRTWTAREQPRRQSEVQQVTLHGPLARLDIHSMFEFTDLAQ